VRHERSAALAQPAGRQALSKLRYATMRTWGWRAASRSGHWAVFTAVDKREISRLRLDSNLGYAAHSLAL
jgi:hypothetical protein